MRFPESIHWKLYWYLLVLITLSNWKLLCSSNLYKVALALYLVCGSQWGGKQGKIWWKQAKNPILNTHKMQHSKSMHSLGRAEVHFDCTTNHLRRSKKIGFLSRSRYKVIKSKLFVSKLFVSKLFVFYSWVNYWWVNYSWVNEYTFLPRQIRVQSYLELIAVFNNLWTLA